MTRILWALFFALLTTACGETTPGNPVDKDTLSMHNNLIEQHDRDSVSTPESAQTWTDSLIERYINTSNNEAIKSTGENKISQKWLFDQTINTDTTKYFVFQIGHDESGDGEKNQRFVTDQWIYIDSSTKRLYEYDVVNDSLIYQGK